MDLLGLGALVQVAAEWLALGTLSGVDWPHTPSGAPFWAARWALRLLVGAVLVAFGQLALALIGVGFGSIPLVLIVSAVSASALRVVSRVGHSGPLSNSLEQSLEMDTRERIGWLVLGALLVAATLRALAIPEGGWDAFSHWGLRAQAFAQAGTIVDAHSEHEYYPPLVPLLEAWLYLHRGGVAIDMGKTIWALVGSAFALCLAWQLRLILRSAWLAPYFAAAIVLSTTALLDGFWTGQADLPLTAELTLATLAVLQWQRSPERRWLVQAGLFSAAAAMTKFEGLPRVGVVTLALVLEAVWCRQARGARPVVVMAAAAGVAFVAWANAATAAGISPNSEHLGPFQPLAIGSVLVNLIAVFAGLRTGGGLLVAAVAWAVAPKQLPRLLVLVVVGQLIATLLAFLVSATSPALEVRTSATRLFEQWLPVALFAAAIGLCGQAYTYNRRGR
jgi:hypothetical protein